MQCAYEKQNNVSVPAPVDKATPNVDWWYDHIAKNCSRLASFGITAILLPPICKTQSGSAETGTGYGFSGDYYDIGSKNQCGSVSTRFGNRQQLLRMIAIAAANGIEVYLDIVLHQMMGSPDQKYVGASGRSNDGRFPKKPTYFCDTKGGVAHDVVAGDPDFAFGLEFAYENATPKGELIANTIEACQWLFETTVLLVQDLMMSKDRMLVG